MRYSLVLASLLFAHASACSDGGSFKGDVDSAKIANKPVSQGTADQVVQTGTTGGEVSQKPTQTITLQASSSKAPLDMIWVIDNSTSMKEEIAQVRNNFAKFAEEVGSESSLQLSVISTDQGAFGLSLDASTLPNTYHQEKVETSSWNLMGMAAAALCDAEGTVTSPDTGMSKVCDIAATTPIPSSGPAANFRDIVLENSDKQIVKVASKLKARMREGAARVFVFVSDDNSEGAVNDTNFFPMINSASGSTKASVTQVFAFASFKNPACGPAIEGTTYQAIAKQTGGEVFDICSDDWSPYFSKLKENLKTLVSNYFTLDQTITVIKSVKIGAQVLSASQYSFSKGQLIILDKSLLSDGTSIVVEY